MYCALLRRWTPFGTDTEQKKPPLTLPIALNLLCPFKTNQPTSPVLSVSQVLTDQPMTMRKNNYKTQREVLYYNDRSSKGLKKDDSFTWTSYRTFCSIMNKQ
ncbi:hypothetical protein MHYP_G00120720 [Metynnis hypsauchen]